MAWYRQLPSPFTECFFKFKSWRTLLKGDELCFVIEVISISSVGVFVTEVGWMIFVPKASRLDFVTEFGLTVFDMEDGSTIFDMEADEWHVVFVDSSPEGAVGVTSTFVN